MLLFKCDCLVMCIMFDELFKFVFFFESSYDRFFFLVYGLGFFFLRLFVVDVKVLMMFVDDVFVKVDSEDMRCMLLIDFVD